MSVMTFVFHTSNFHCICPPHNGADGIFSFSAGAQDAQRYLSEPRNSGLIFVCFSVRAL